MQRANGRFIERLPLVLPHAWHSYVYVALLCAVCFFLRELAEPLLPPGYPFLSFFPAVILSSFLFGVRPGIFAALICGVLSWYFFIAPQSGFAVNAAVVTAMAFYTGVVTVDIMVIHWMQRANYNLALERERNRKMAENRELLFHELQHRVSNNLQVVAALLSLHRRQVRDEDARKVMEEAAGRLALIGKISRALYRPDDSGQEIGALLDMLSRDLAEAAGREDIGLVVDVPGDLVVGADAMVPLALVTAEAVSNAFEHGFDSERRGHIHIALAKDDEGMLRLRVSDDGRGLPAGFDPDARSSLGLRIAGVLASQLGGRFTLMPSSSGGAMAMLDFPARP